MRPADGQLRGDAGGAMDDIVESAFEQAQQRFAGVLGRARRQGEVTAELLFEQAIKAFQLLLFAQTFAIFGQLAAAHVHARRLIAAFDGALGAFAATAFEIQLDAFTSAKLADRIDMTSHG